MKIYIAGSISGKSADEVFKYFNRNKQVLESWGYTVLNPLTAKGHLRTERTFKAKDYRHPISTNRAIIGRDRWMVGQADIVYMNLSEAEFASIGCMFELAWAYELKKHIIAVVPEGNIHQHAFVLQAADIIFQEVNEALEYLQVLARDTINKSSEKQS